MVNESLGNGNNFRQADWSESVAAESKDCVETSKEKWAYEPKDGQLLKTMEGFNFEKRWYPVLPIAYSKIITAYSIDTF